ncbi:MAG TPA: TolC family protein [Candidatus Eisenbacteria bacterium]|nr:TolC family protein [Candidatus Eisenbacteria bacterium]
MNWKNWIPSALIACALAQNGFAQQAFTWTQLRDKFESSNPSLLAGQINIDESRAQEITAFLRPNPDFTAGIDQLDIFTPNPYRPFQYALPSFATSYLHERQHKRELRLESAKKGTSIAVSQQDDLERTLLFSLRGAFVQALQAKAILALARENLAYYDRVLSVSQDRLAEGDIARVDMQRLHLQRVQYESDVQTADVNFRTARIQLLALLNDRTPVERFDITGPFEFSESTMPLDEFRRLALESRPDLRAAMQSVDKARTDHQLAVSNGSTDPTFGLSLGVQNPPIPVFVGFSINIPLRIFDRNQGEKARTELDIRRNQRLQEAAAAQVYSDVDSAYAALTNSVVLLRPYKATYLDEAASVRDTVSYSYQQGGASLLDFLQAQQEYRSVRVNYLNLVGSYLTAAAQLNLAVGREVIQ